MIDFNAYWDALQSGGACPRQGANVNCGSHGMARSVTQGQSYDEGRVEEVNRLGVHGSAWFHGLQQHVVYSPAWECSYKLNDQPVRERVTASYYYLLLYY